MPSTTVYVTGATGFISQHICVDFLAAGYTVIGSVRSKEKGENLKKLLNSEKFSYEIVPDIVTEGAFDESLKRHPEVEFFLHTASPFTFEADDIEKELLIPAVRGTENALKAVKAHGKNVKHVVITSSYAAIADLGKQGDPNHVDTEEQWSPLTYETSQANNITGYFGSKKVGEKAAWDFMEAEKPHFSLSTVNPTYVFGPQAFDSEVKDKLNTSAEIVNSVLNLKASDKVPESSGPSCDVRDVAKAHLVSVERYQEIKGKRLLIFEGRFTAQVILDILNANFSELKGKLPVGKPGSGQEIIAGQCKIDSSKLQAIMGFKQVLMEKSIVDSVAQLLKVKAKK